MSKLSREEILRSCSILEIPDTGLTRELVVSAWKKRMASSRPLAVTSYVDEPAITINNAKDCLLRWLESEESGSNKEWR